MTNREMQIAYVQYGDNDYSPNATEYQQPLQLARRSAVTLFRRQADHTPPEVQQACRRVVQFKVVSRWKWPWTCLKALRDAAAVRPFDVVVTGIDEITGTVGYLARRMLGTRWVISCWDHPFGQRYDRAGRWKRSERGVRSVLLRRRLAVADATATFIDPGLLADELKIELPKDRLWQFGNGVDTRRIHRDVLSAGPVQLEPGLIGCAGVVRADKFSFDVLRALACVARDVPAARLRLIGQVDPAYRGLVLAEARRLGVADRIELTGWRPFAEALGLLRSCAVCLHCYEPRPWLYWNQVLKIGEYMALGKAVVAVETPGTRYWVHHGVNGLLVPPGDVGAMAEALTAVLKDCRRRRALERAAVGTAAGRDWSLILGRMSEQIEALVTRGRGTANVDRRSVARTVVG